VKLGTRNITGAKRAVDQAVGYARDRHQFGRPIAEFGLIKQKLGEMTLRCWVGDAMVYRALGDVDRALESLAAKDPQGVLKTIETFAIECSINKVWTSETLAFAVDEAVQVFGGNGYSREFPVERGYRDARITRIYEGTNEINRLIVPTRLVKRAPELFTRARASRALSERPAGPAHGPLATEHMLLADAKRQVIAALGYAVDAYGDGLKDEQELLGHAADMAMEIYAIESAVARAEKLFGRDGARGGVDIARIYANDATDRIAVSAKRIVAALSARGRAVADLAEAAGRSAARPSIDTIAARRAVADVAIRAGGYPF
jgi:hypothetical protein